MKGSFVHDLPLILWCGRFADEDDQTGRVHGLHARFRRNGLSVVRYDTELCRVVEPTDELSVVREGDLTTIKTIDDAKPMLVVLCDTTTSLRSLTVEGRARLASYPVLESTDISDRSAETLVAVDEVWASSESDRQRVVAGGVPGFMAHTVPSDDSDDPLLARIQGLQSYGFKGNGPAVVRHNGAGELWARMKIPSRASLATHGVNGRLAAFGHIPIWNIAAKSRAYQAASTARRAHSVSASSLERHEALGQLGVSMNTSVRKPIAKVRAVLRLNQLARAMDVGDPRLGPAIQEYWDSEHRLSEPTAEFMDRRRAIWDRFGAVPLSENDAARLSEVRDRHLGERVFILGNGPSLNKLPLEKLAAEYTFGVNRIGLLFDRVSWRPNYWTVTDWRVGPQLRDSFTELDGITKFIPNRFRGVLPSDDTTYWYHSRRMGSCFADQFETDITKGIPSRATVLVTAIQQAFYLGFREIYVIGVDVSYSIPESVIQSGPDRFGTGTKLNLESTKDDDVNHFDPRYFGAGAKWHDPNVDDMKRMFRVMRKGVEFHGGSIKNATAGGSLEEFDRVEFESLF